MPKLLSIQFFSDLNVKGGQALKESFSTSHVKQLEFA